MFKFKIIKTETEYQAALQELDKIFSAKPGTPEGDRFELLALLIGAYEQKNFPIGPPDPIEVT